MDVNDKTHGYIHTGPHRFEMQAWIACAPFEELLGIEIVSAVDGRATLTMPFVKPLAQGGGLLHGGALVSLADTAVVMAIKSILEPQTHFATIDLQTQFLHPVKQGTVKAEAEVERLSNVAGQMEVAAKNFTDCQEFANVVQSIDYTN